MKTNSINLIGNVILLTVVATIIFLFAFAGNGSYIVHPMY